MLPVELISSTNQKPSRQHRGTDGVTKKSNAVKQKFASLTRVETGSLTYLITVVAHKLI